MAEVYVVQSKVRALAKKYRVQYEAPTQDDLE